jgi:hypothetical protein
VEFIEQQSVDIQPLGPERICTQNPVERIACLVNDRLAAVDHLEVPRQRRRSPHHRRGLAVDDACLLTIRSRRIALSTRLRVEGRQIEGDAGKCGALTLLLRQLDVTDAMLPRAVWVQPAEQLTHDVVLPRQERERLACVLPLAVAQDFLEEMHHALVLGLALFAEVRHRGA